MQKMNIIHINDIEYRADYPCEKKVQYCNCYSNTYPIQLLTNSESLNIATLMKRIFQFFLFSHIGASFTSRDTNHLNFYICTPNSIL